MESSEPDIPPVLVGFVQEEHQLSFLHFYPVALVRVESPDLRHFPLLDDSLDLCPLEWLILPDLDWDKFLSVLESAGVGSEVESFTGVVTAGQFLSHLTYSGHVWLNALNLLLEVLVSAQE